jgi:hypothetical protein
MTKIRSTLLIRYVITDYNKLMIKTYLFHYSLESNE